MSVAQVITSTISKLHHAAMTGNFAKCKHLVRLGADLDIRDKTYGGRKYCSDPDIVKFLHEKGADIHACDKYGDSCVMLAAKGGQLDLASSEVPLRSRRRQHPCPPVFPMRDMTEI